MPAPSKSPADEFQDRLGYRFRDPELLRRALTHSSKGRDNYERLEFLGDRVLGLVIADIVYRRFPHESEGDMARRHAALACTDILAEIARGIGLDDAVLLSEGERAAGGSRQDNLLADSMEAVLGAVYLDSGLDTCRALIEKSWGQRIDTRNQPPVDPKTALQEWAQARRLPVPEYAIVGRAGPDHAPVFEIEMRLPGHPPQQARGASRRIAEKEAARLFLAAIAEDEG
jgi:ribonuclease III